MGGLLARQRRDDGAHRYPEQPVVHRRIGHQETRAAEHDGPSAVDDRIPRSGQTQGQAAEECGSKWELPAPAARAVQVRRRPCGPPDREVMIQVYIPATLAMLQRLVTDGSPWPVNGTAVAVTPTVREADAGGGGDELADAALREAALASLRLLAADEDTGLPPRRAVLAAEVEDAKHRPDLDDAV